MLLTSAVIVAWFAGLLVMFNGFERSQELKSGALIVDHQKRNKFTFGLSIYLVVSLGLLVVFITNA
ncbi:MAG: hypothetical protein R8G33_01880 [Gammaproteobacteria bacterium]|nr:hypothetical protein [Gammaproteobacteria bacterium]